MAKGLFSQTFCLLTDGATTIEQIRGALEAKEFEIVKQVPAQPDWRFGGPTLLIAYEPEDNGYIAVDVVPEPWPDTMGNPKTDPQTFGAWGGGHFGPFTFPGGLARAEQHSWAWAGGKTISKTQRGFIRIRLSYAFGAKDDDPILPKDYDPLAELIVLNQIVLPLLEAPGVLCYYNPNGEVLRDGATFREHDQACKEQETIPLVLWMNVRYVHVNDKFWFMDTIGNGQLDLPDVEAVYPKDKHDPSDIDAYLRNVTLYLLSLDRQLQSGEEIDGPGESDLQWTIDVLEQGALDPPRQVVRLMPKADRQEIQEALAALGKA